MSAGRVLKPQPGPQEQVLASPADICISGGGAGGGKTWALLAEPTRHLHKPGFGAVIFRREYPQITNQGGLWDESYGVYPLVNGEPRESAPLEWKFPAGTTVAFRHLQHEKNKLDWKGAQLPFLGVDQLEDFTDGQFWYLTSRLRSLCGVVPYVRGTCNPVPDDDPVGGWLRRLIDWWINPDTGYAIAERSGVLRWYVRINDELFWANSRQALIEQHGPKAQPKSLTFIPMRLSDNRILMEGNPQYEAELLALPYVERERLLGGNWNVRPAAGNIFNRAWFEIVDAAPAIAERVRYWDKAGTSGGGDWSAGVRISRTPQGLYFVEDVIRDQWSALQRNTVIRQAAEADGRALTTWIEQEPGSGGKESAEISVRELAGWDVRIDKVTGDKRSRAKPMSAQAEAGNVKLVRGRWNEAFLKELHAFTGKDGAVDDQVDAACGAFNKVTAGGGGGRVVKVTGW